LDSGVLAGIETPSLPQLLHIVAIDLHQFGATIAIASAVTSWSIHRLRRAYAAHKV